MGNVGQNRRFKLYGNGTLYNIEKDWLEEHPITDDAVQAAQRQLEEVLESRPDWNETVNED